MTSVYSVILGKDASCIHKDLVTALGENAPSIQTVRKWVQAVSEGRDDMEDERRPGRPVTACGDANIFKVLVLLSDDRRKNLHHNQCKVLQDGAARETQTYHSKETTRAVVVRHLVSPRQCASPYGLGSNRRFGWLQVGTAGASSLFT
ncbi:transposase [Elysia marginata]|uniref:Transposase n=1 Tax=Elysia marginata TaxID=1093978 RepID=A0AAV4J169_9GAST|nr:transposase [Elysia marginata]